MIQMRFLVFVAASVALLASIGSCRSTALKTLSGGNATRVVEEKGSAQELSVASASINVREDWLKRNFRLGIFNDMGGETELQTTSSISATDMGKPVLRSSVFTHVEIWPITESDGFYHIGYDFRDGDYPKKMKEKIKWALEYLEYGSNLRFHPKNKNDKAWFHFVSLDGMGCASSAGYCQEGACEIRLEYPACDERYSIIHEVMHRLSFGHEHQRADASTYVYPASWTPSDWVQWLVPDERQTVDTPYDIASIMQYDTFLEAHNDSLSGALHSRVPALTSCDWNKLNTIYPGNKNTKNRKGAPKCKPHELPNAVEFTPICEQYWGRENCEYYCETFADMQGQLTYSDGSVKMVDLCQFKDGARFARDAMYDWKPPMQPTDRCKSILGDCCDAYCERADEIWRSGEEGKDNGFCVQP